MLQNYAVPAAILAIGAIIAIGLFFYGATPLSWIHDALGGTQTGDVAQPAKREADRHLFGDPNAPVTIVEFSDLECPFCARLHPTLKRIVSGSDGQINWEYRHLPLPSHPNAEEAAFSTECVARLAGNDAFWKYTDALFSDQRSLGTTMFETEAVELGVDLDEFRQCKQGTDIAKVIQNDLETAVAHGGRGTPFSVIVYEDGTTRSVSGALPYAQWQTLLP